MKKFYILLCFAFILSFFKGSAQNIFENEWISFSSGQKYSTQQYFKIPVSEDGVYRVTYNMLKNAGVPVQQIKPDEMQLFFKGIEQSIDVHVQQAGKFEDGDYIEFFGLKNDGWFDRQMIKDKYGVPAPDGHANPYYSFFTDTSMYYFTWKPGSAGNKRMLVETDTSFAGKIPLDYFKTEVKNVFTNYYAEGEVFASAHIINPDYVIGEGWVSNKISLGSPLNQTISHPNVYVGGPDALVNTVILGAGDAPFFGKNHRCKISLNNYVVADTLFWGYDMLSVQKNVPLSTLSSSSSPLNISSLGQTGLTIDDIAVSYFNITYPHSSNFSGENTFSYKLILSNTNQNKEFINFNNYNTNGTDAILLYFSNDSIFKIPVVQNGTSLKALVPVSGKDKECFLTSVSNVKTPGKIRAVGKDPVNFARFINYEASAKNSEYVIITHTNFMNKANQYRVYREKKYKVLLADVADLYEQFSYGIEKHPYAIRNFCNYMLKKWDANSKPQHLFLLGKGLESYGSQKVRKDPVLFADNLVPPFGYPASDILYTSGLDQSIFDPAIPTGRLAARSEADIDMYLNKVIEFEQQPMSEWMKNVLHFGGGASISEQKSIQGVMNVWADTVRAPYFGGKVTSFFKTSNDPIQPVVNSFLRSLIDTGVTLITFFGHAYNSSFDQDIEDPNQYKNFGRYPLILANSCLIGNIFLSNSLSTSEEYVLKHPNRGSIGFIASTSWGFPSPLAAYSTELYKNIFRASYGSSIGVCMKKTINYFNTFLYADNILRYSCNEMTLHGDPAIVLNSFAKPDYLLKPERIYFSPGVITTDLESFTLNIICSNQGKASTDSFYVKVNRKFPTGVDSLYILKVPPVFYRDTFHLTMKIGATGGGLNKFDVNLDENNEILEEYENNNSASTTLLIKSNAINPVYPPNFAIVPNNSITLKASTDDPFAPMRTYVFEMDTSDKFSPSSPAFRTGMVSQTGGVVSWKPAVTLKDSMVYYWRVSVKDSTKYGESSFIYIPGKTGWSQAHFNQFKNNNYTNMTDVKSQRKFDFIDEMKVFKVQTNWRNVNEYFYENGTLIKFGSWGEFNVAIINPITAELMENPIGGKYGSIPPSGTSSNQPSYTFDYKLSQASQDSMANLINNVAPDSSYIIFYSTHGISGSSYHPSVLQKNVIAAMVNIGVDTSGFFSSPTGFPFIVFGKKGWKPGKANVTKGLSGGDIISQSDTLYFNWKSGNISTQTIGPAKSWTTLHWRVRPYPGESSLTTKDTIVLDLYGITKKGKEVLLLNDIKPSVNTYNLSFINADTIPYLRLKTLMGDDSLRTAPQLNRWQIYYEGVPEAAINPSKYFSFYNQTMQEGDTMRFATAIENISEYDMDSLLVNFWVSDNERKDNPIVYKRQRKLLAEGKSPQDTIIARVSWPTQFHPGLNKLWIEANPNNDQPEQYHFNNIGVYAFQVNDDKTDPVLDVTFDDVHILNGDIVSGKPNILIRLIDENKFLMLRDTSLFTVQLISPSGVSRRLRFNPTPYVQTSNDLLTWYPATSAQVNNFRIMYNPVFTEDGKYQLLVQASDASKKQSGVLDYKITFEVINKPSITEMLNYPNPFSTSTQFVFTLTGSETPTDLKIQIFTVSGKVVREIMLEELGNIHIGRNITDYAWDGKDEFGDKLANGIYFYRVLSNLNGNSIEKKASGADKYFNKGFGKMYLMR